MGVSVEIHHTGNPDSQSELRVAIEHVMAERKGDWRVSILGSQANDQWELKVFGPNGFERTYALEGSAGEHSSEAIRAILGRLLPSKQF